MMMNAKILIVLVSACLVIACSKDKFDTRPHLELINTNTNVIPATGSDLVFDFKFTDKEGDLQDSIFVRRVVGRSCSDTSYKKFVGFKIPNFLPQKNLEGEITFTIPYGGGYLTPCKLPSGAGFVNDTATFRFFLRDAARNTSDTVTSPTVIILRN